MAIKTLDINFCDISKNLEYVRINYTENSNNYFFTVPNISPLNKSFNWVASFEKSSFLTYK